MKRIQDTTRLARWILIGLATLSLGQTRTTHGQTPETAADRSMSTSLPVSEAGSTANSKGQGLSATQKAVSQQLAANRVEVVFVLDTTGSMKNFIAGAKQKIWSISGEIRDTIPHAEIRMGLVAYRDRGDHYITRRFELSEDMDAFYAELMTLHANGGGDGPEAVNQALAEAVADSQWTPETSLKFLFLVGDAPPKMYTDDMAYPTTCHKASQLGITINAVQAGKSKQTRSIWQQIAKLGSGEFVEIPHGGGMKLLQSPYDQQIHQIVKKMHQTVVLYGPAHAHQSGAKKLKVAQKGSAARVADRAAHLADAHKGSAITGDEDLVTELMQGHIKMSEIDRRYLPHKMQQMTLTNLQEELRRRIAQRKDLQQKMATLGKQRRKFVAAKRKELPRDAFDQQVCQIIAKQARLMFGAAEVSDAP